MKGFKFSLQAVLTIREREEQTALQTYAESLRILEAARQRLEMVNQELMSAQARMQERFLGSGPAIQIAQLQDYCQLVEKQRRECEYAVQVAQNKSHEAFTGLVAARQARAVVTKYFEKQKKRHNEELSKHEQKKLDDLVNAAGASLWSIKKQNLWN